MRLKEEKTLIKIEIITLVFIVIASVLLQFLDAKIKDYNDKIICAELERSDYLQLASYHQQKIHFWNLSLLLAQLGTSFKKELLLVEVPIVKSENIDRESEELMNKYKTNEIDVHTYIVEMGNLARKREQYHASKVRQIDSAIKGMRKDPPNFFLINIFLFKSICLNIQLFGACLAIILFVRLFMEINKRIDK